MDFAERMNVAQMTERDILLHPSSVAAGLQHLDGLVFFDSSGNFPDGVDEIISIVAARPSQILRGNVSDVSLIEEILAEHATESSDLPNGGLCGWIEYEGSYCFGVYPEMLVYRHSSGQWYERGSLSSEILSDSTTPLLQIGKFAQSMGRGDYLQKVETIKEYIAAGDIYQVNLAQKFSAAVVGESAFGLYSHLRALSPAPHSSYMSLDGREVLSSSPETFLRFDQDRMVTRPIKGTRPRFDDPAADQRSAFELRTSEKEVSELVMITDLGRNDLGQVCDFGSVQVEALLKLEKFEHVYHLVSTVSGRLQKNGSQVRALQACFPGGSITGAPKKRAMEIIEELEELPRGLYTGAMGYFGFNGQSQFNIVIRTMVREGDQLHYHVGAGIVTDSTAEAEYEETLQKAKGMRVAVEEYVREK
ncbi:aminodeoxychorismate synthase, component I [Rubritalea profundi]|uniref:Aminodeoxychorismate synthase, component I n=2 Tax=Rubritalea profundi TaxID=1658618 RepID=A0A2S7U0K7_9BACT|nr:aminodeoxychorismate synthase, component I [Rubritalea profundi]